LLFHTDRFAGHWAGTQESALRTIAMLRIIDAVQLAHALNMMQQFEEHPLSHRSPADSTRVIDAEPYEIRK
jgi:hypothetical protein